MCLELVYRGSKKRKALAALPDEFTVYKLLIKRGNEYTPLLNRGTWRGAPGAVKPGRQKADWLGKVRRPKHCMSSRYRAGWHAWLSLNGVLAFHAECGWENARLFECRAFKSDIRTIGEQCGQLVVVLKYVEFPASVKET